MESKAFQNGSCESETCLMRCVHVARAILAVGVAKADVAVEVPFPFASVEC